MGVSHFDNFSRKFVNKHGPKGGRVHGVVTPSPLMVDVDYLIYILEHYGDFNATQRVIPFHKFCSRFINFCITVYEQQNMHYNILEIPFLNYSFYIGYLSKLKFSMINHRKPKFGRKLPSTNLCSIIHFFISQNRFCHCFSEYTFINSLLSFS